MKTREEEDNLTQSQLVGNTPMAGTQVSTTTGLHFSGPRHQKADTGDTILFCLGNTAIQNI